jgi:TM2 domain-containing membrane protein YozV
LKNEWLAGLLSLLVPGFGQFYNLKAVKGTLFLAASVLLIPVGLVNSAISVYNVQIQLIIRIVSVYDAVKDAGRFNRGDFAEGHRERFQSNVQHAFIPSCQPEMLERWYTCGFVNPTLELRGRSDGFLGCPNFT